MSRSADPFRVEGDDVLLRVRATPGARQPGLDGLMPAGDAPPAVRIRVRARAQDGAANAELIATLAAALGRARGTLALQSGAAARLKVVRIAGRAEETALRLKELFA